MMKTLTLILAALLACVPASAQTTQPTPFFLGVWQAPDTDVAKWQSRSVNTFVGHVDNGGAQTKAQWEAKIAARGGRFITYPGADVVAEAKQPGRAGFMQLDEPDLSNHVDRPGYTPAALDALYQKTKATGLPMLVTMGAMDNQWYDGFPKPGKTDGSKYGHRAGAGGWLAYADIVGFDFYIYSVGRTSAQFDVIERLLERSNDWSGGKPVYLFIETCTQGRAGATITADQWEEEVWHAVNYCQRKGYKLAGIIYFSHQVFPNWKAFDITPADVDARMRVVNPKVLSMFAPTTQPTTNPTPPATQPDWDGLEKDIERLAVRIDKLVADRDLFAAAVVRLSAELKAARAETAEANARAERFFGELAALAQAQRPPPATQPATQPTTKPAARVYFETSVFPIAGVENPKWTDDGHRSYVDAKGESMYVVNPDWVPYAFSKGFTPYAMAYDGTLNQAFAWADDSGNPRPMTVTNTHGGLALDGARRNRDNVRPALNPAAVRAAARCAANPAFYGFSGPPRRLVFDIEGSPGLFPDDPPGATAPARRKDLLSGWLAAIRTVKAEGADASIWFGPPWWMDDADTLPLQRQVVDEQGEYWLEGYNHEMTLTFDQWKAAMDGANAAFNKACPDFKGRVVLLVCPSWQIHRANPSPEAAAVKGTMVDLDRWRAQLRYAVSLRTPAGQPWTLALWTGGGTLAQMKGHIDALAGVAAE